MLARIGAVIYWLAVACAAFLLVPAAVALFFAVFEFIRGAEIREPLGWGIALAVPGVVIWLLARLIRYILT
jgi:hypothetical protein